jgi:hypothetical protein
VEDCSKLFEDIKFRSTIVEMFPPICKLINTNLNQAIVSNAINTINMLLLTNTDIILENMDEYLTVLIDIGSQNFDQVSSSSVKTNMKVKWRVVQGITTIMELKMSSVIQKFEIICHLMLGALMHKD